MDCLQHDHGIPIALATGSHDGPFKVKTVSIVSPTEFHACSPCFLLVGSASHSPTFLISSTLSQRIAFSPRIRKRYPKVAESLSRMYVKRLSIK
jgi:hypothetical protein